MITPPSSPKGFVTADDSDRLIVLIVEDEGPIAEALTYVVEEAGFTAMVAPHGKAGLALALQCRPALILSDVMMPQMGGPELIRALREALDTSTPPIVLMTAADLRFAQNAGADGLLTKPFELTAVEAMLRRFLGGH